MNLQVIGRNVQVTPALRDHAERKLERLERRLNPFTSVDVVLCSERNPRVAESEVVEISLQVRGELLHVKERAPDMRAAIDTASDRLLRLLGRHREQRRRGRPHHHAGRAESLNDRAEALERDLEELAGGLLAREGEGGDGPRPPAP